ncbi:helix-turn-helix domain-containing protein [Erwinia mallotivora]|uniref:helix-turn-helix domain-containing protein n=1 Tax=Erwinia mallotivora TaxID=69222 RepID=UPI0035EC26A8
MNEKKYLTEENDWHRADIICSIKKTGTSMSALSRKHGLSSSTLANTLYRKWPRGEAIISEHLNTPPWEIWPPRYKIIKNN